MINLNNSLSRPLCLLIEKYSRRTMQFNVIAICFIIAMTIEKFIESTLISQNEISVNFGEIFANIGVICCFFLAILLVLFLIISLFSKQIATIVCSSLSGLFIIMEVGLTIYHNSTGILMGNELLIRPAWETLHTIKSAVSGWLILFVFVTEIGYTLLLYKLSKKEVNKFFAIALLLLIIGITPLFFVLKPNQNAGNVNKTWFFIRSCMNGTRSIGGEKDALIKLDALEVEYDSDIINHYISMFPERNIIDTLYPLEKKNDVPNNLGPFFQTSSKKPNVVLIIVESLGSDWFGQNPYNVSYCPFLDSLSRHSLVWTNCIGTTPRSFGAVPAVTASVPHGLKGFQFGNIPNHNSLFTILKDNGYKTNAFYAGSFSFDHIADYLIRQNIDYFSPYYKLYKNDEDQLKDGTSWGYNDKIMYDMSLNYKEKHIDDTPYLDLYITLTSHENLNLPDKNSQRYYEEKANQLISQLPSEQAIKDKAKIGKVMSILYTDDALKKFFDEYEKIDKDQNTIFIITGDHSMNNDKANPLDAYHVPVIIWSKLLKESRSFPAMVSHNDITPSITELLHRNFSLDVPETVHWVGDALDTANYFRSNLKSYLLRYSRQINDVICKDYIFSSDNWGESLYKIGSNLKTTKVENDSICLKMKDLLNTLVYVDSYVYNNNKLIKNAIFDGGNYLSLFDISIDDTITCFDTKLKPSVEKPSMTDIFSKQLNSKYKEVKIVMTADFKYTGCAWQDKFPYIIIECNGKNMPSSNYFKDYTYKYISTNDISPDEWIKFEMTKTFETNKAKNINLDIYMMPTEVDAFWDPEISVSLKNIKIEILGINNK